MKIKKSYFSSSKSDFDATKKGFTIIELLFVIGIIGILGSIVTANLRSATTKSNVVTTKAALANLPKAIGLCCSSGTETLQTTPGDLCDPSIDATLPAAAQLKATGVVYSVTNNCNINLPEMKVVLTGHQNTACNDVAGIFITMNDKVTYPAGCE